MEVVTVLVYAAPVLLAALGEVVVQRSGVINIGLEGTMLAGCYFGVLASYSLNGSPLAPWLGMLAAAVAGTLLCLIAGWFIVKLCADQVVVGTALNLVALGLTGTLYRARFGQTGQLLSVAQLPRYYGVDAILLLLLISVPAIWYLIHRTNWGLAVRATGEYPKATEAAGISVERLRLAALAIGGAFGGLAGGYLTLGITGSFAENMTAGRGFVAIAIVTFGRWSPGWVAAAGVLIGYLQSLQFVLQARGSKIPFQFLIALPYFVALAVLVLAGKGTQAPGALAESYRREK